MQTSGTLHGTALQSIEQVVSASDEGLLPGTQVNHSQEGHTLSQSLRPYSGSSRSWANCCRERSRRSSYSRQTRELECSSSMQRSTGRPGVCKSAL